MPRRKAAAIPAAAQHTLLEWIELEDADKNGSLQPACSKQDQAIHARIILDPQSHQNDTTDRLQAPPSLRLPPLG